MGFRDTAFLVGWGLAMVGAAWVYALTGWPAPGLIAKDSD